MSARRSGTARRGLAAGLAAGSTAAVLALLPAATAAPAAVPTPQLSAVDAVSELVPPSSPATPRSSAPVPSQQPAAPVASTATSDAPSPQAGAAGGPTASPVDVPDVAAVASPLAAGGIPATALDAYTRAADGAACGIDWSLLAAIGRVESDHGRFGGAVLRTDGRSTPRVLGIPLTGNGTARIDDTDEGQLDGDPVYDRAVGPMQFIPGTWARFGRDGDGDGRTDPFDVHDAAAAAAAYLCSAGGDLSTPAGQARAVFAYNHSDQYVVTVLGLAAGYAGRAPADVRAPDPDPQPTMEPVVPPAADLPVLPSVDPPAAAAVAVDLPPASVTAPPSGGQEPAADAGTEPPSSPEPTTSPEPTATGEPVAASEPAVTVAPTESTEPVAASEPAASVAPTESTEPVATSEPPAPEESAPEDLAADEPASTEESAAPEESSAPEDSAAPDGAAVTTEPEAPQACPGDGGPEVVDVLDATGDPAIGDDVVAQLAAMDLTVGDVIRTEPADSAIAYPAAELPEAQWLAGVLDAVDLMRAADVPHVTVVLGSTDSAALVSALEAAVLSCD